MSDEYACDCGDTFDSEAAYRGHTESCPEYDPDATHSAETDADTTETAMSDTDSDTTTDEQFKQEVETILPGKDTFANLRARRTGYAEYQILSTRNSGITLHTVTLTEPSCTCEDWQYNREDGEREICAHYALAFMSAPDIDVEDLAVDTITTVLREVHAAKDDLQDMMDMANGAAVESRASQATAEQQRADTRPDPDELVDMLEDGLEGKGFNVDSTEIDGEQVVFELGYYDGDFDDVREVTSQCDLVGYDGDHNFVKMGDVQEYVEEVL